MADTLAMVADGINANPDTLAGEFLQLGFVYGLVCLWTGSFMDNAAWCGQCLVVLVNLGLLGDWRDAFGT